MILPLPERFRTKIVLVWTRAGYDIDGSKCWFWTGWNSGNGYGKVSVEGKAMMAHRAVYEMLVGPIPDGLILDHGCRHRACCNPAHLEPVTVLINTLRGDAILFEKFTNDIEKKIASTFYMGVV